MRCGAFAPSASRACSVNSPEFCVRSALHFFALVHIHLPRAQSIRDCPRRATCRGAGCSPPLGVAPRRRGRGCCHIRCCRAMILLGDRAPRRSRFPPTGWTTGASWCAHSASCLRKKPATLAAALAPGPEMCRNPKAGKSSRPRSASTTRPQAGQVPYGPRHSTTRREAAPLLGGGPGARAEDGDQAARDHADDDLADAHASRPRSRATSRATTRWMKLSATTTRARRAPRPRARTHMYRRSATPAVGPRRDHAYRQPITSSREGSVARAHALGASRGGRGLERRVRSREGGGRQQVLPTEREETGQRRVRFASFTGRAARFARPPPRGASLHGVPSPAGHAAAPLLTRWRTWCAAVWKYPTLIRRPYNMAWAFATAEHAAPALSLCAAVATASRFDTLRTSRTLPRHTPSRPARTYSAGRAGTSRVGRSRRVLPRVGIRDASSSPALFDGSVHLLLSAPAQLADAFEHRVGVRDGRAVARREALRARREERVRGSATSTRRTSNTAWMGFATGVLHVLGRFLTRWRRRRLTMLANSSNTRWRLRRSSYMPPDLLRLRSRVEVEQARCTRQRAADRQPRVGVAVADAHDADLVAALRRRLEQGVHPPDRSRPAEHRHQSQLWCERERRLPDAAQPAAAGAARLRCRAAMFDKATADAATLRVSDFQRQVGASLQRLGETAVAEEHITADGHSLDYALVDERIAIEVDGPSHFVAHGDGARRNELGNTVLKRRQLGALGWRLVAVPFFEWYEFNDFGSARARRRIATRPPRRRRSPTRAARRPRRRRPRWRRSRTRSSRRSASGWA